MLAAWPLTICMMNVVFNHDTVVDHLEWFPWQYLGEKICTVVFGVDNVMYRGHNVPVTEYSHRLLAAVNVLELGLVSRA